METNARAHSPFKVKIRQIFPPGNPLRAVASVTITQGIDIAIHDIKVIESAGRTFVGMPSEEVAPKRYRDIVHPINSHSRRALEDAVLHEFYKTLAMDETSRREQLGL